jgi:hypothetical protein
MGRQGRRPKQLLDEFWEKRRHHNLKEEAIEKNKYINK